MIRPRGISPKEPSSGTPSVHPERERPASALSRGAGRVARSSATCGGHGPRATAAPGRGESCSQLWGAGIPFREQRELCGAPRLSAGLAQRGVGGPLLETRSHHWRGGGPRRGEAEVQPLSRPAPRVTGPAQAPPQDRLRDSPSPQARHPAGFTPCPRSPASPAPASLVCDQERGWRTDGIFRMPSICILFCIKSHNKLENLDPNSENANGLTAQFTATF